MRNIFKWFIIVMSMLLIIGSWTFNYEYLRLLGFYSGMCFLTYMVTTNDDLR